MVVCTGAILRYPPARIAAARATWRADVDLGAQMSINEASKKKPVALVERPPAKRRDSKGGGGETPQTDSTSNDGAMQQLFSDRDEDYAVSPSDFLMSAII
jgi:hypothetical protein